MRSLHSWEGLRSRQSSLDSQAIGITDLGSIAFPVIVVGHEQPDGVGLNVFSRATTTPGGTFAFVGVLAQDDLWCEALEFFDLAGGGTVELLTSSDLADLVGVQFSATGWMRRPQKATGLTNGITLGFSLPGAVIPPGLKRFERPGILVRAGTSLVLCAQTAGSDFSASFYVREV